MKILMVLLSLIFAGCGTFYLTTSDLKEGTKSVVKGDGWGLVVATATILGNTKVPVVVDTYHFSEVIVSPSNKLQPGGSVRLAYKVPFRGYKNYNIGIGLRPVGEYRGMPIQGTVFHWSFSDNDYQVSHQTIIIGQSDSSGIWLR